MWRTTRQFPRKLRSTRSHRYSTGKPGSNPGEAKTTQSVKTAEAKPSAAPKTETPPVLRPAKRGWGGTIIKLLGVSIAGGGGVVAYSWYDPKFREQVESNVPYSAQSINLVLSMLSLETRDFGSSTDVLPPLGKKRSERTIIAGTPRTQPEDIDTQPLVSGEKIKISADKGGKGRQESEMMERRLAEREAEVAAENAALEKLIDSAQSKCEFTVKTAVDLHKSAVAALNAHTQQLRTAMDRSKVGDKDAQWQMVGAALDVKNSTVRKADSYTDQARESVERLKTVVNTGRENKDTARNPILITAADALNKLQYSLDSSESELESARTESAVMVEYKNLVEQGRKQFKKELESILPDVKLGKRGKKLTEDELNSLIAHAHRRIEQLQDQVAEQMVREQQRLQQALRHQKKDDETRFARQLESELEKRRQEFEQEKIMLMQEARVEFESELRQQLRRQAAAHSDHLTDVVRVQRKEFEEKFENDLEKEAAILKDELQREMAGSMARLRGIEAAVDAKADAMIQARNSQKMWLACQTLKATIKNGNKEASNWEDRLKPLAKEFVAIKEAAGEHPFVGTLVDAVPEEALTRGVYTEDSLRQRFIRVKRICRRVAMIDESGGSLFKYILSFLQSFFILEANQHKLAEDEAIDPEQTSTFNLLSYAEQYLHAGDLETTVRLLNQLSGEPQRVAADWINEALLLLETRQISELLIAHASASGADAYQHQQDVQ